jgi:hypothetical protein
MGWLKKLLGRPEAPPRSEAHPLRAVPGALVASAGGNVVINLLDPHMQQFLGRCVGVLKKAGLRAKGTGQFSVRLDDRVEIELDRFYQRYDDPSVFDDLVAAARKALEAGAMTDGPVLVAEQELRPGQATTLVGPSHRSAFSAVFEDDGDTGYFYGLDRRQEKQPILDALHVYDVAAVTDRHKPSKAQVVWSADGLKVALFINGYPHAAFDFVKGRGYCRSGFPPPAAGFSSTGHEWSDEVLVFFS